MSDNPQNDLNQEVIRRALWQMEMFEFAARLGAALGFFMAAVAVVAFVAWLRS